MEMTVQRREEEHWPRNRIRGQELSWICPWESLPTVTWQIPNIRVCRMPCCPCHMSPLQETSAPWSSSSGFKVTVENISYFGCSSFWLLSWICDPQDCELILECCFKPLDLWWFLTQPRKTNTLKWTITPKCPSFIAEKTKAQCSWLSCPTSAFWWQGRDLNWILLSS